MEKFLKELISFKTISQDVKENKKAIFWVKEKLKKYPLIVKIFEFSKHFSFLALTKKTKNPKLWLAAHVDVVSGSNNLFLMKTQKEKFLGRGTFDMKFAIACYLKLIEDLREKIDKYNFGIMITSDEEIGGFFGTKKILEQGFRSNVVFLPDGGENWKFEIKAKGAWHLKLTFLGKSAHGSRPWEGKGANEKLVNFLKELSKVFPKEPCKIKDHWHRTLNIGKIEGGKATNQVADFAQAFIDIRYTNKNEKEKIKNRLESLEKTINGIKIEEIVHASPYSINPQNQWLKIFSKIAKEKFNIKTDFLLSHGSSDARFFLEKQIPVILIRPRGGGQHSDKEWIDKKDLERFYQVLKEFVKSVAKI